MSDAPIHSTGRGGAGNIGPDSTIYTDGGIVREGVQGLSADGEYSTGRGGVGNIAKSPRLDPQGADSEGRRSVDYIPETALREPQKDFHTGRGGSGNVYREKYGGHSQASPEPTSQGGGLKEKIKHVFGKDGKHQEPSPLKDEVKE